MGIECICIDDKGKPLEIPSEKWVKKGNKYHVTHIFVMLQQGKIKGCELAEFDISNCIPYNCYRLSRFIFKLDDLKKIVEMIKHCDQLKSLSDLDIQSYVNNLEISQEK